MVWWGKGSDKPSTATAGDNSSSAPPPAKALPKDLQKIVDKVDKDENFYDDFVSGYAESTDSNVRYAAYASRIRTIMMSAHRYVAYTSDIGESFRPVAHPLLVRGAYGVSWAYVLGDVSYEGYKAYLQNQRVLHPETPLTERQEKLANAAAASMHHGGHGAAPGGVPGGVPGGAPGPTSSQVFPTLQPTVPPLEDWRTVMAQRAIFQSIASMGLPAFTIHSVVRYAGRAMKDVKNKTVRTWGPIGLGLAVVPLLPSMFDKPVENAVEFLFHAAFAQVGGQEAVGAAPATGREKALNQKPKEKEL